MRTEGHGFGGRHENMVFGKTLEQKNMFFGKDMRTREQDFLERQENKRT